MSPAVTQGFFNSFFSDIVIGTFFFWCPIVLGHLFWRGWVYYVQARFIANMSWVTLEIQVPRDVMKSPRAMEIVFNGIYLTKDGNLFEKYVQGFTRPWHSFEIASISGQVRFFVHTTRFAKNIISSQLYAQYPDVEIHEVEDYTKTITTGGRLRPDYDVDGMEFVLSKEDPYPIKTYIDYGLNELATEEEQKSDPITSIIEFMGSIGEGEQLWLQVLVRATKKDGKNFPDWKEEGKKIVEKLMKRDQVKDPATVNFASLLLSPGERLVVEAIERDVAKLGYDVGIRFLYLAPKQKFNSVNIAAMAGVMRQFNALNLNGFRGVNRAATDYFSSLREPRIRRRITEAYVLRSYFHPPHTRKMFVLNVEELATVYHFPGRVSETPTFGRIEAKKSEPPVNLPV